MIYQPLPKNKINGSSYSYFAALGCVFFSGIHAADSLWKLGKRPTRAHNPLRLVGHFPASCSQCQVNFPDH
ncbi:hypothetical protein E2C01_087886 [Portunus trituberculatus]|uniref:Uncharacterized protein n=1 Tax=Portunus trituberculatus TaxID=210409 RepID=A0A5B7J7T5_PORTR|nr:hypothetical protein [Portunus trituberculatus]